MSDCSLVITVNPVEFRRAAAAFAQYFDNANGSLKQAANMCSVTALRNMLVTCLNTMEFVKSTPLSQADIEAGTIPSEPLLKFCTSCPGYWRCKNAEVRKDCEAGQKTQPLHPVLISNFTGAVFQTDAETKDAADALAHFFAAVRDSSSGNVKFDDELLTQAYHVFKMFFADAERYVQVKGEPKKVAIIFEEEEKHE